MNKAKNGDQFDEEMTEDEVDWHDFVIVEQIELYNDQEMEQQQLAHDMMASESNTL